MKRLVLPVILMFITLVFSACGKSKGDLLTERIQYDVTINSPEQDLGWWVQNLEAAKREKLVKVIINSAKSGDHKLYDVITNKQLALEEIKDRGTRTEIMTLQKPNPPYESYDTLVTRDLQLSDISKVRFLEEWYLNEESGMITKKVIAICPMVESYTESGELRGHLPLYWISLVKKFPLEAK